MKQKIIMPQTAAGSRLDVALTQLLPDQSRSALARMMKNGALLVNGKPTEPSRKVGGGELVEIDAASPEPLCAVPEKIPLAILYEDADVVVVNKPVGMVVHPSAGHHLGTLAGALLHYCGVLSGVNGALRPGIVHRLDRDTSGVILTAKNDLAHRRLAAAFAARTVEKEYLAICLGVPKSAVFSCADAIMRHPVRRKEMTVAKRLGDEGRAAHTDFEVLERFLPIRLPEGTFSFSLVKAKPKTGRTHQIRVHLAHLGFPVAADAVYRRKKNSPSLGLTRHALHASKLTFSHPTSGRLVVCEADLPEDMRSAIEFLRKSGKTSVS